MHPGLVEECAQQIVPSLLLLFDGLKRAYAAKALEDGEDDDDDEGDEDDDSCEEVLSSDEDDIDQEGQDYIERLQQRVSKASANSPFPVTTVIKDLPADGDDSDDDDDDDDDEDDEEETALEGYITPLDVENCQIDEYVIFKQVLEEVQGSNPGWYSVLTGHLSADQQKCLSDVIVLADQRRAAAESKRIEEAGGIISHPPIRPILDHFIY